LRRVVVTPRGRNSVVSKKLGYSLIDGLFRIVNSPCVNVKIELLREVAGLIYYLHELPECLEYFDLVNDSAYAVEDMFMNLCSRKYEGDGQEYLHRDAVFGLTGLCCCFKSVVYCGTNGGIDLIYNLITSTISMLNVLDTKFSAGLGDVIDNEEFDELYSNLYIYFRFLLNLTTEFTFHRAITDKFLDIITVLANDDSDYHNKRSVGYVCCQIICNLEKSHDVAVQSLLYKHHVKHVSHLYNNTHENENENENSNGGDDDANDNSTICNTLASSALTASASAAAKYGDLAYKPNKVHSTTAANIENTLKGTMCPDWFVKGEYDDDGCSGAMHDDVRDNNNDNNDNDDCNTLDSNVFINNGKEQVLLSLQSNDNTADYCCEGGYGSLDYGRVNGDGQQMFGDELRQRVEGNVTSYDGDNGINGNNDNDNNNNNNIIINNNNNIIDTEIQQNIGSTSEGPSGGASLVSVDAYGREIVFQALDSAENSLAPLTEGFTQDFDSNAFENHGGYTPGKFNVPANTPDRWGKGLGGVEFKVKESKHRMTIMDTGQELPSTGVGITHTMAIPKGHDPWEPPAVLQVLEETHGEVPGKQNLRKLIAETVVLNPSKKLSRITFKTGIDKFGRRKQFNHSEVDAPVTMWRWKHTPGSVVSQHLFRSAKGLDGKQYFYYYKEAGNVYSPAFEAEHPGMYPAPHPPVSVVYIGSKFPSPPEGLLPDADTFIPIFNHSVPPECPRPKVHAIKLCREACTFINGKGNCPGKTCKMHGHIPIKDIPFFCRPQPVEEVDTGPAEILFDFRGTIFEPRNTQCDAKDYYNSDKVYKRSFEHNWSRGAETKRFTKFLTLSDARVKRGEMKVQDVHLEVKKEMKKHCRIIEQVYEFYAIATNSMAGYGSGAMSPHQNGYMSFLKELKDSDPDYPVAADSEAQYQELVRIFLTVNLEEDKTSITHKFNVNTAMMKHEWVEALVRVATVVYGSGDPTNEFSKVPVCFNRMMKVVENFQDKEIITDGDVYRKKNLYTHQVCRVLERYKVILSAAFICYPVSNHKMRTKKPELKLELFGLDDWERLMAETTMYQKGLNRPDAKAAFMRARMHVTDEIVHRDLYTSITLIDFYEALARAADYWACGGSHLVNDETDTATNLENFLKHMVQGLAVHWKGELRVNCHGHGLDQKKFCSLDKYLPKESEEQAQQNKDARQDLRDTALQRKESSENLREMRQSMDSTCRPSTAMTEASFDEF
jgi:hypothetical protein